MSTEQDQEKLMNAIGQSANNALSASLNLASLRKSKLEIKVKSHTARDDLNAARSALKKGIDLSQIKQSLASSPVVSQIKEKGQDVTHYLNSILDNAIVKNEVERQGQNEKQQQRDRQRSIER